MKTLWSKSWVRSVQPRKQRKYIYNAPLHVRKKFLRAMLSKELREKYGVRNVTVRKGDTVMILRGKFRGHVGKVVEVDYKKIRVYVEGATLKNSRGEEKYYPIHPSKLMIIELDLSDPKRKEKLESKK